MKVFQWDNEKNEWLKIHRGVSFEQAVILMEREDVLETIEHPNQNKYPGQKIAILRIDDYAYLVPYVQESETIFLILKNHYSDIPSRKATNKYVRAEK